VLPPIRPAVVWLVSDKETAFFFEHALASMDPLVGSADSLTIWPDQYEQASASLKAAGSTLKPPDLVIFNGWTPPKLPASGRFVIVNACPEELATPNGDPLAAPQLHLDPTPHPITQHVTLQGSRLAKAGRLTLKHPARLLAQSADADPLIALIQQPDRQTLLVAFDVLDSDLPFRNAFPLLLRNTVAFMHEEAPSWLRTTYAAGETIRPLRPIPADAAPVLHVLHAGKSDEIKPPVINQAFSFTNTNLLGAVRLDVADQASFAALNIGDASESSIAPSASAEDAPTRLGLSRRLLGGMPWAVLAMIAAMGVVFEWLSYHFRWTE
jgi:hypothetical protein